MKKILATMMLIGSVTVLMTSCKKEGLPAPAAGTENNMATARDGGGVLQPITKTYTLVRRGNDSLIYYNDGRLGKVQHGPNSYTQYNYGGFGTITAKTYSGNSVDQEITYQVDVQTGRVFESESTGYTYYSAGTVVVKKTHRYEYDAAGHITKRYNKADPDEKIIYHWSDNNMNNARSFDKDGKEYHMATFGYQMNQVPNKLKLMSARTTLDPYLRIFGKPTKSSPIYETSGIPENPIPAVRDHFVYELDAYNYPVLYKQFNDKTGDYLKTVNFNYIITQ